MASKGYPPEVKAHFRILYEGIWHVEVSSISPSGPPAVQDDDALPCVIVANGRDGMSSLQRLTTGGHWHTAIFSCTEEAPVDFEPKDKRTVILQASPELVNVLREVFVLAQVVSFARIIGMNGRCLIKLSRIVRPEYFLADSTLLESFHCVAQGGAGIFCYGVLIFSCVVVQEKPRRVKVVVAPLESLGLHCQSQPIGCTHCIGRAAAQTTLVIHMVHILAEVHISPLPGRNFKTAVLLCEVSSVIAVWFSSIIILIGHRHRYLTQQLLAVHQLEGNSVQL